jgi:hypothetical protein
MVHEAAPNSHTISMPSTQAPAASHSEILKEFGVLLDPHQPIATFCAIKAKPENAPYGAIKMVNLLLRPVMFLAAAIAGWFVAEDAVKFDVIQMVVALFLITVIVAVAAFWETLSDWFTSKNSRPKPEK